METTKLQQVLIRTKTVPSTKLYGGPNIGGPLPSSISIDEENFLPADGLSGQALKSVQNAPSWQFSVNNISTANINAAVTDTTFATFVIPANTFTPGQILSLFLQGTTSVSAASTHTVKVKINGVDAVTNSVNIAISTRTWSVYTNLVQAPSNTIIVTGGFDSTVTTSTGATDTRMLVGTASLNPTVDNTITITGAVGNISNATFTVNASYSVLA